MQNGTTEAPSSLLRRRRRSRPPPPPPPPEELKETNKRFGRAVRAIRYLQRVSVAAFAKKLGIAEQVLRAWEDGYGWPSIGTVPANRLLTEAQGLSRPKMDKFEQSLFRFKPPLAAWLDSPRTFLLSLPMEKRPSFPIGLRSLLVEDGWTCATFARAVLAGGIGRDGRERTNLSPAAPRGWLTGKFIPSGPSYDQLVLLVPGVELLPIGKRKAHGAPPGPFGTTHKKGTRRMPTTNGQSSVHTASAVPREAPPPEPVVASSPPSPPPETEPEPTAPSRRSRRRRLEATSPEVEAPSPPTGVVPRRARRTEGSMAIELPNGVRITNIAPDADPKKAAKLALELSKFYQTK
jgi:hypothetical protein